MSDRSAPSKYDIWVMDRDGQDARPLGVTGASKHNRSPVFLPDGTGLFFLGATEWNRSTRPIYSLWRVDVDGGNLREVAGSRLFTAPLQWQPR